MGRPALTEFEKNVRCRLFDWALDWDAKAARWFADEDIAIAAAINSLPDLGVNVTVREKATS